MRCHSVPRTLALMAVAGLLAACEAEARQTMTAYAPPGGDSGSLAQSRLLDQFSPAPPRSVEYKPERGPTWRAPSLASTRSDLLFVSDFGADAVYVFALPGFQREAKLTGFIEPQG